MNKLLLPLLLFASLQLKAQITENQVQKAENLYQALVQSNAFGMAGMFTTEIQEKLPPGKIVSIWQNLQARYGAYQRRIDTQYRKNQEDTFILYGLAFEKDSFLLQLSFNEKDLIKGFLLVPYEKEYPYRQAEYVAPASFQSDSLLIGEAPFLLPAVLTYPKAGKDVPLIVLVHGSGPQNMDVKVGPNHIFRNIAEGLSSKGIAVLRYDKRSHAYPTGMSKTIDEITVNEETIEDAVLAVQQMRKKGFETIYVAGHSLGGYLAPRIAANSQPNGVIVLAGSVRPLEELIEEQMNYLFKNDSSSGITEAQLQMVQQQVQQLKNGDYNDSTPRQLLPLGLPASYWQSVAHYNPAVEAAKQDLPYLILQGERDYQVTMADFELWKQSLDGMPNKQLISFPTLNHLFLAGEGMCLPAEYDVPADVSEAMIDQIVAWITKQ